MRINRRHLRRCLGAFWLFDAVLQCQPSMFTSRFADKVLGPASQGQPALLLHLMHAVSASVAAHPVLCNVGAIAAQLAIGLTLVTRHFNREALGVSVVWSVLIWVVGEGLGGVASGATLLGGAPGAALLYALIALFAWPTKGIVGDEPPSRFAVPAWCALWLTGAVLQLIAGNNSGLSLTMTIRSVLSGSPNWIVALDRRIANYQFPAWSAALAAALFVLVALWVLVPGRVRHFSLVIGSVISLVAWVLFQGMGNLTSGLATDPNTGPLVILLALAVHGTTHVQRSAVPVSHGAAPRSGLPTEPTGSSSPRM